MEGASSAVSRRLALPTKKINPLRPWETLDRRTLKPSAPKPWSGDDKRRFRSRVIWKNFVKRVIAERGAYCELCGQEHKKGELDLHHLDPHLYDTLDETRFKLLDTKCHDLVEWMAVRLAADPNGIPNKEAMLAWLGPFLPTIVRFYGSPVKKVKDTVDKPQPSMLES